MDLASLLQVGLPTMSKEEEPQIFIPAQIVEDHIKAIHIEEYKPIVKENIVVLVKEETPLVSILNKVFIYSSCALLIT